MAVGGEDDRLVEAVQLRLALGKRAVDVRAGDLAARRDRVVVGAAPAADLGPDAALGVDVLAERNAEDDDIGVEVVEADSDRLGALVDDRSQVDVLAQPIATQELDGDLGELLGRLADLHHQEARRRADPLVMRQELEAEELLLVGVPVGADALEDGGAVIEAVGHDVDVRVAQRHELAAEERPQLGGRLHRRGRASPLLLQHSGLHERSDLPDDAPVGRGGHKRKKYTRAPSWRALAEATEGDQWTGDADVPSVVNSARYR